MKPVIGITSNYIDDDIYFFKQGLGALGQEYSAVAVDYLNAIIYAGGVPIVIEPSYDKEYLKDILEIVDGVLVSGGNDVESLRYGENSSSKIGRIFRIRDESDLFITNYAIENDMPFLGICRGLQVLNTAMNGTLITDIKPGKYIDHSAVNSEKYIKAHSVNIEKDSILYEAYKEDRVLVNSFHHQGINKLGENLRAVARSDDGLCEAVEMSDKNFVIATQWHPEMLFEDDKVHGEIFKRFIKACKDSKQWLKILNVYCKF